MKLKNLAELSALIAALFLASSPLVCAAESLQLQDARANWCALSARLNG